MSENDTLDPAMLARLDAVQKCIDAIAALPPDDHARVLVVLGIIVGDVDCTVTTGHEDEPQELEGT